MEEIILNNKKNGMQALLLIAALYLLGIGVLIVGGLWMDQALGVVLFVLGILWVSFGWIPFCGLKVLKPQEALVLTLFGKYVGTLKNEGFYFVNPFCASVNPAAKTIKAAMWTAVLKARWYMPLLQRLQQRISAVRSP